MNATDLVQRMREQRLTTLALADQIGEERWREPALPGGSIHDVLAHLLGWDEWAMAVFDISAETTVAACDVSDRAALAALLDTIPADHALAGVVHAAGTLDDSLLANMDEARPKSSFQVSLATQDSE